MTSSVTYKHKKLGRLAAKFPHKTLIYQECKETWVEMKKLTEKLKCMDYFSGFFSKNNDSHVVTMFGKSFQLLNGRSITSLMAMDSPTSAATAVGCLVL